MEKEITYEEYAEATSKFNNFILHMGGNPAYLEIEDIERDIKKWPEDIQKAWDTMNKWDEQGDGEIY